VTAPAPFGHTHARALHAVPQRGAPPAGRPSRLAAQAVCFFFPQRRRSLDPTGRLRPLVRRLPSGETDHPAFCEPAPLMLTNRSSDAKYQPDDSRPERRGNARERTPSRDANEHRPASSLDSRLRSVLRPSASILTTSRVETILSASRACMWILAECTPRPHGTVTVPHSRNTHQPRSPA
jgi:hypothetical protein